MGFFAQDFVIPEIIFFFQASANTWWISF